MKLTSDLTGNIRSFTAKLGWREQFDPKEIELLSSGVVPMLIPPASVQGRKNDVIRYDISPYSTLEFHLSCILSREQLGELMLQCIELLKNMQQLFMDHNNLILDLDKVYVQLSDRSMHFIYLPLAGSKRETDIPEFFRTLIKGSSRSSDEQSALLDAAAAWLDNNSPFKLSAFEGFIRGEIYEDAAPEKTTAAPEEKNEEPRRVSSDDVATEFFKEEDEGATEFFREEDESATTFLDSSGATMLLDSGDGATMLLDTAPPSFRYYLLRASTGEKVEMTRFPFLAGSEVGSVTYYVFGNNAVSRRHAEFTLRGDTCVITDQKSTNKTYVNNCALEPFVGRELEDGDRIHLANESFTFIREG